MTVYENMNKLTPAQSCQKLAASVIERAIEDVRIFELIGVLVNGNVNTDHHIFRRKKQFASEAFESVRNANPRDVYALLRFFDTEIKPFLKICGVNVTASMVKRAVFGGKAKMRNL